MRRNRIKPGRDPIVGHSVPAGDVIITRPAKRHVVKKDHLGRPVGTMDAYYLSSSWIGKRDYVCERDENTCQYCGRLGYQADHIIPRKRGGSDKVKNLVCCCSTCNEVAGNRLFDSFDEKKAYILQHRPGNNLKPTSPSVVDSDSEDRPSRLSLRERAKLRLSQS